MAAWALALLVSSSFAASARAQGAPLPPPVQSADSLLRHVLADPAALDTAMVRRLTRAVRAMTEGGAAERAVPLAAEFHRRAQHDFGADSYESVRALDWLLSARDAAGLGMSDEALAEAREVVRLRRLFPGQDSTSYARSLGNLASRLAPRGALQAALDLYRQGLGINQRHLPPGHAALAIASGNVGNALLQLGRYEEARAYVDRSVQILRDSVGTRGTRWSQLVGALRVKASLALHTGEFAFGEQLLREAVRVADREGPSERMADVAGILEELSQLAYTQGDAPRALAEADSALDIRLREQGATSPELVRPLWNRARALRLAGDLAGARNELERVDSMIVLNSGGSPIRRLEALSEMAFVDHALGNTRAALETLLVAERLASAERGALSPERAVAVVPMAGLLCELNRPAEAESLLANHVRDILAADGELPFMLFPAHLTWARAQLDEGKGDEAQIHLDEAARLSRRAGDVDLGAADLADLRVRLAVMRGRDDEALREAREAVVYRARSADAELASSLAQLADVLLRAGHPRAAFDTAIVAERLGRRRLRETMRGLSESEALGYAGVRPAGLDPMLSALMALPDRKPPDVARAWAEVAASRGLVLDEIAERARFRGVADTADAALRARLDGARERLSRLIVRGATAEPGARSVALDSARIEVERLERRWLAAHQRPLAGGGEGVDLAVLARALPAGTSLVAYVWHRGAGRDLRSSRFMAFTLIGRRASPQVSDLGDAATLDSLVTLWREQAGTPPRAPADEPRVREIGARLRERVWDVLPAKVQLAATTCWVADGSLNLVNLAALPSGDSAWLAEQSPTFVGLDAERDLFTDPDPAPGRGLLAIGAPDFSSHEAVAAREAVPATAPFAFRGGCAPAALHAWSALPASAEEVSAVAALWRRTVRPDSSAIELTGAAASEREFRRAASGRRVLHVATHALALGVGCVPAAADARGVGGVVIEGETPASASAASRATASLTCLALAGANLTDPRDGDDDGLLLPDEVATLDLSGVECVVLSACESGLGEVRPGEGVLGLRRALRVAGANSTVASLWPVRDADTRAWMQRFYEAKQSRGLSLGAAVQAAMRATISARRAAGLDTHPFGWGAFEVVGDRLALEDARGGASSRDHRSSVTRRTADAAPAETRRK